MTEDGEVAITSSSTSDTTTSNKGNLQKVGFLKSLAKKFMQDIENKKALTSKKTKRKNKKSRCCPSKNSQEGCPCELVAVTRKNNKIIDVVDGEKDDKTNTYHNGGSFLYHQSDKPPTDFGQGANSIRFDQAGVITNNHKETKTPKEETDDTGGIDWNDI
mmetsp:Transcript_58772/g.65760  ORF Transcript_58772/g.65760 Transcript_58772/m.65760 type:complete len:160 (+) Transcript_58772:93-572(+)|eukprot:CAMPEP_0171035060 /NCGR_PEP_ID=MMETSP0736-20130129/40332_1 /TAXON_ID=186038 /ORGANISM="Fragilariopsis kerguelensis, Strain L26-C5" /LENGTH=159 /DNA_ID=CAMNT_0011479073 /DNA_START=79 /DNA_END=555 /DNA_ORIENTATION=-